MKIIDFEKKGNAVRFYLGEISLKDWGGDDWDDKPYEHNSGRVQSKYISGYRDIVFPFDYTVLEPKDDWSNLGNSDYCKDDMKARRVPCIVALEDADKFYWGAEGEFRKLAADGNSIKFYFGDTMDPGVELFGYDKLEDKK